MFVNRHIVILGFILMSVLGLISCESKSNKVAEVSPQSIPDEIILEDSTLGQYFDKIDFTKLKRLTQAQYDSLQLKQINSLSDYGLEDLSMGKTLFEGGSGKLLTLQVITEGEITEYLLSYDTKGNLVDSLVVAYEDMVEYYTQISSLIKKNQILVQTINFTYDGNNGNEEESDTTIAKYQITPELRFLAD